jgi:hypothetical protein
MVLFGEVDQEMIWEWPSKALRRGVADTADHFPDHRGPTATHSVVFQA